MINVDPEDKWQQLVAILADGVVICQQDGIIVYVNQHVADLFGRNPSSLVGEHFLYPLTASETREIDIIKPTGQIVTAEMCVKLGAWEGKEAWIISLRDITDRKRKMQMQYYDPLTSIPNQYFLSENLSLLMGEAQSLGTNLIVVYLALDGLNAEKNNKLLSEQNKDNILIGMTQRLISVLPKDILLARISYSDFIVVFKEVAKVMDIIPTLIQECSKPYKVMRNKITLNVSIGLTSFPQERILYPDELIRQSYFAAYEAKFAGGNQYKLYDKPTELQQINHNQLIDDIRIAMAQQQLEVFYQPKVDMQTGEIHGAEALLRLRHPEKGILSPDSFLPKALKHPVYTELGEWVLHQVLTDLEEKLISQYIFPISINISPYHLTQDTFLSDLKNILKMYPKVKSSFIELEILETEVLSNLPQVKKLINECKKIGVLFALDDFGTGYSSLTYLRELSANKVKLDQSFVRDIIKKPENIAILKACINMCKLLKREVIAEGVETIEIGKLLLYLGCTNAQGYAISGALQVDELCEWSKRWRSFSEWDISTASKKEGGLLINAIIGHCARIDVIKNYLALGNSASITDVLKICPLELWINRQRKLKPDQDNKLKQLHELHTEIYVETVEIFTLHEHGRNSDAVRRLDQLESQNINLLKQLLALNL